MIEYDYFIAVSLIITTASVVAAIRYVVSLINKIRAEQEYMRHHVLSLDNTIRDLQHQIYRLRQIGG